MDLKSIARILIVLHAGLGGIALLAGAGALVARKGRRLHRKAGIAFFYSMMASAILALIISFLPNHANIFLFSIGAFSIYFLLSGVRSLQYKRKIASFLMDKIIAYLIIAVGLFMILFPIIRIGKPNIVLLVLGLIGLIFGVRDLMLLKDEIRLRKNWLKLHLGKMTGGYIAAVSAFFVVNQILPGIWNWFVPGAVGSVFIAYWISKLDKTSRPT